MGSACRDVLGQGGLTIWNHCGWKLTAADFVFRWHQPDPSDLHGQSQRNHGFQLYQHCPKYKAPHPVKRLSSQVRCEQDGQPRGILQATHPVDRKVPDLFSIITGREALPVGHPYSSVDHGSEWTRRPGGRRVGLDQLSWFNGTCETWDFSVKVPILRLALMQHAAAII